MSAFQIAQMKDTRFYAGSLARLATEGPTAAAFTFKHRFPPPGVAGPATEPYLRGVVVRFPPVEALAPSVGRLQTCAPQLLLEGEAEENAHRRAA